MPFISIELSQNITFALEPFAKSLHAYLAPVLGVGIEKLKSKKVIVSDYVLGDGSHDTTYVRLKLELKQGRRPEVLKTVLGEILKKLSHAISEQNPVLDCRITCEIAEIDREFLLANPITKKAR